MMENMRAVLLLAIIAAIIVLIAAIPIGFYWYKAGVQVEVYRRQGVEMTQWEVFLGAKPIERTIQLKAVEGP